MRQSAIMPALRTIVALSAALWCWPSTALANGRFPAAGQIVVSPTDGQHLLVRATYGFLQSTDGGASWHWVCEQSIGFAGIEDPAVAIIGDGVLLAGLVSGLSVSTDRACTWGLAGAPLVDEFAIDVAAAPSQPGRAVAITATGGAAGHHVIVAETVDSGQSWHTLGEPLGVELLPTTIEVAGSDPMRLYASGLWGMGYEPSLLRSDDGGQTWTRSVIMGVGQGMPPYIGGVHPADPARVYVRVDVKPGDDTLWVSDDGGATFEQIGPSAGEMLGLAISPDGTRIAIGGPALGVQTASTADHVFEKVSAVPVRCMKWHETGIHACGDEEEAGFTVGRSTDEGQTFSVLHHRWELQPLDCPADTTTGAMCPAMWPSVAETLGAESGSSSTGAVAPDAGPAPVDAEPKDSGCACMAAPPKRSPTPFVCSLLALLSVILLRGGRARARSPKT
jgi:photosystem II stability/assembly factor-like uncharacterized protein